MKRKLTIKNMPETRDDIDISNQTELPQQSIEEATQIEQDRELDKTTEIKSKLDSVAEYLTVTFQHMKDQFRDPDTGRAVYAMEAENIYDFRVLDEDELPDGAIAGIAISDWEDDTYSPNCKVIFKLGEKGIIAEEMVDEDRGYSSNEIVPDEIMESVNSFLASM